MDPDPTKVNKTDVSEKIMEHVFIQVFNCVYYGITSWHYFFIEKLPIFCFLPIYSIEQRVPNTILWAKPSTQKHILMQCGT